MAVLDLGALPSWWVSLSLLGLTQRGFFVGVAFSPLADFTSRASGLRSWTPPGHQQCGVPTLVLVTSMRHIKC
jgi:hypothetical protein